MAVLCKRHVLIIGDNTMAAVEDILAGVKAGTISVEDATVALKKAPFVDLDFAKVDLHRKIRCGASEVVYGAGKTADQIAIIVKTLIISKEERVLVTRVDSKKCDKVMQILGYHNAATHVNDLADKSAVGATSHSMIFFLCENSLSKEDNRPAKCFDAVYYEQAGLLVFGGLVAEEKRTGNVLVVSAGTSDIPVAEEAALVAEFFGSKVKRLNDAGVAGIHRLLSHLDDIMDARVIVAVAGMEGALASVVGGLADCPVIAVPTSVGYGANLKGVATLLAMLNSCASGVSVVNIDNGYGAGYLASLINKGK